MSNQIHDNDFEIFLQEKVNEHKMFASNDVWAAIHKELHGKKRWPALSIFAMVIILLLTVSTILLNHPTKINFVTATVSATEIKFAKQENKSQPKHHKHNQHHNNHNLLLVQHSADHESLAQNEFEERIDVGSNAVFAVANMSASQVNNSVAIDAYTSQQNTPLVKEKTVHVVTATTPKTKIVVGNKTVERMLNKQLAATHKAGATNGATAYNEEIVELFMPNGGSNAKEKNNMHAAANKNSTGKKAEESTKKNEDKHESIEAFINSLEFQMPVHFKAKAKKHRWAINAYTAPSISYRKLVDDKTRESLLPITAASGPQAYNPSVSVNDVVKHKPALGTEVGVGFMYSISPRLRLRTGLQFNIRQYFIDSYKSGLNVATIAIIRNNRLDTINQFTSISNTTGYAETELDSKLYQVSAPIGLEWDALKIKRWGLTVGGTLQPTLTLNQNVYLISTDYKYYTDGSPFFRTWNFNTSIDANITYTTKSLRFYLGPQLRTQHLPTYSDKYPIKEYRLDYGLRIGFTKQL